MARVAVVADERHAGDTTRRGVADLLAVARVCVVTLERDPRLAARAGITRLVAAAGVPVAAVHHQMDAPAAGLAAVGGARAVVAALERDAGRATQHRVARFEPVAHVVVVTR